MIIKKLFFIALKLIRFLKLRIFGRQLGETIDESIGVFRDEKDEGRLIVTPIYLLAGCSVPIWLIGLTKSNNELDGYELASTLSGILSVGIGDTFASIGGSSFGKLKWKGSNLCSEVFCTVFQLSLIIQYDGG